MIFNFIKTCILNFLFPIRCIGCETLGLNICNCCLNKISLLKNQECPNCRKGNTVGVFCDSSCQKGFYFDQLVVSARYQKNNLLKKLVVRFKYKFSEELGIVLGKMLKTQLNNIFQFSKNFGEVAIIPVPIHSKRLCARGFNQAKVLADYLSYFLGSSSFCNYDCLIRDNFEMRQADLSKDDRVKNLEDAFSLDEKFKNLIKNKFIFLVDDIATTCSTLNECSRVLKNYGAHYICAIVLGRGNQMRHVVL